MGYTQLDLEERYQIFDWMLHGWRISRIAAALDRAPSTIYRELKRNRGQRGWRPLQGDRKAMARRLGKARPKFDAAVWTEVERLIRLEWSPEQISKRFRVECNVSISHEWIYQYIYRDKLLGGRLYCHLRQQKPRRRRFGKYGRRSYLVDTVSIEKRPKEADSRHRFGHWEGDTMIGKGSQGGLLTLVERKSRYTLVRHLVSRHGRVVSRQVGVALRAFKDRVKTITYDNGREFSEHKRMEASLDARVFFAHPYSSWERGTSENTNGLLRQYFPKKRSLAKVTRQEIARATDRLNHRPRKCLGYRTPYEVFFGKKTLLTVALAT